MSNAPQVGPLAGMAGQQPAQEFSADATRLMGSKKTHPAVKQAVSSFLATHGMKFAKNAGRFGRKK
jgi:hypothetical protein